MYLSEYNSNEVGTFLHSRLSKINILTIIQTNTFHKVAAMTSFSFLIRVSRPKRSISNITIIN